MNSLLSFALIASAVLTPETQAVLDNLKALPGQGKMIVSWTFPWDWHRYRHMDFGVSPDPYGLTTPPPSPDAARFVEWRGDTTEGLAGALRLELIRRYEAYSGVKLDPDDVVPEERRKKQ